LLLLLLDLKVLGKVDERLSLHLLPHLSHLLWCHVLHLVRKAHAHATLLLEHRVLLLLAHVRLPLGVLLLLQYGGIHYLVLVGDETEKFADLLIPGCCCCCCANICAC
jgi:hypothetical protein